MSRSSPNVSPPSNRPQQPAAMFLKPEARLLPGPPVEQPVRQFYLAAALPAMRAER